MPGLGGNHRWKAKEAKRTRRSHGLRQGSEGDGATGPAFSRDPVLPTLGRAQSPFEGNVVVTGVCSGRSGRKVSPSTWPLTINGRKPRRDELPPDANLCQYCSAKCCQYLAIQIDEPTTARQFDYLIWFLLHQNVLVFREKGRWFVLFQTPCSKLLSDGRCGIYEHRPRICRAYSTKRCEYEDDWVYERVFETPEQVREFAEVVLSPPGRVRRTPRPGMQTRRPSPKNLSGK